MLREEDLKAAVDSGVITAAQQAALESQAASRHAARPFIAGRDERFRFLRGFNDVFLSLGVVLVTGAFLTQWSPNFGSGAPGLFAGAAVLWAISEVLVGRYKAVLPGMAAVLGIGLLCSLAGGQWAISAGINAVANGTLKPDSWANFPFGVWLAGVGCGGLAVLLFYLRFRLPFALLPLAAGVMATVLLAIAQRFGVETTWALINTSALALGLATFAMAMRFDSSDPERLTRRSDCGFWLHLAAAPFIVHPVISLLAKGSSIAGSLLTIGVVAVLGAVALIIDRRALLVSSLSYFGIAVGYLVTHSQDGRFGQNGASAGMTTTLLLLGGFVIMMGLGWHTLRGILLKPFAGSCWLTKLPPVQK